MSGEDQERFEDYLELEHFVEELQAGHVAHPPAEMTPGQARIYRMAALFRSASPEASEPLPEFADALRTRLESELQQQQALRQKKSKRLPFLRGRQQREEVTPGSNGKPSVSRRSLLAGGAAVAASLVAGAAIGNEIGQANHNQQAVGPTPSAPPWPERLIAEGQPTTWIYVTTLAELGDRVVRFATDTVVGYLTFDDGENGDPDGGKIIAMSAACTHMGCIVQWQKSEKRFICPCHGGLFTEYGKPDARSPMKYLTPLPRLNTKVENGKIFVEVPENNS